MEKLIQHALDFLRIRALYLNSYPRSLSIGDNTSAIIYRIKEIFEEMIDILDSIKEVSTENKQRLYLLTTAKEKLESFHALLEKYKEKRLTKEEIEEINGTNMDWFVACVQIT